MIPRTLPVLSELCFLAWISQAQPGDRISYHEGLLGIDRAQGPSALPDSIRTEIHRVASHAMALAEVGHLLLAQRRVAEDRIAYLAIMPTQTKGARR
jgi:hypothetical protein